MLHDAEMPVTCDNLETCNSMVYLPCAWTVGGYDLDDSKAEKILVSDHDWIVQDGKHYCCEECRDQATQANGE